MSDEAYNDWAVTKDEESQELAEERIRQHAEEFQNFVAQHCRSAEQSDLTYKQWLRSKKAQAQNDYYQRNNKTLMQAYAEKKKPNTSPQQLEEFNLRTDKSLLPPTFDSYSKSKTKYPWSQELERATAASPYTKGMNLSPTRR